MSIIALKQDIHNILKKYKSVAVIAANTKKERPARYIAVYFATRFFQIFPVNPLYEAQELFGHSIMVKQKDLDKDIDLGNIFRRSEHLMNKLEGILKLKDKTVWPQKTISNSEFTKIFDTNGIDVIENKCMPKEHRNAPKES